MMLTLPAHIFAILLAALPPCQWEDSTNCAWNAQVQGNGEGRSFVSLSDVKFIAEGTE